MSTFPRIGVFIDGSNLYASAKELDINIDFKKLRDMFNKLGFVVHIKYYTALHENEDGEIQIKPMIDWLSYNGYLIVSKKAKEFENSSGIIKIKGNMDIEIAVDAMSMCNRMDVCYLFTGDGDFAYLIKTLQIKGIRVIVVSSVTVVADELRRSADQFSDLSTWKNSIDRRLGDT